MRVIESWPGWDSAAHSQQSPLALGWLSFFLSGMQTAFGTIAAAYLTAQGWTVEDVGFVLTIGGTASLVSQVPGGELVDAVRAKRLMVVAGVGAVALSVVILGLYPVFPLVALAEVLQGLTGGVLGPAVVAISLGLVGHPRLAERLGKNQRFAAAGGVTVTLAMGLVAYSGAPWVMFIPAVLAIPALGALSLIRPEEIHFGRACGAEPAHAETPERASRAALIKNRPLLMFAGSMALFQLASASVMPLLAASLAYGGKSQATPLIAALIIVPQLLVGLLAPWVGRLAEKRGRKPLLLLGFAALPIRTLLFALINDPFALLVIQLLDVVTGAVLGVLTAVVIADVTKGTGRFNLAQGMFGTVMGVGASLSPTLTGLIVDRLGRSAGFLSLAAEALVAFIVLAVFLPETKPEAEEGSPNLQVARRITRSGST